MHNRCLSNYTKLRDIQRQISVILIFIIMRASYRVPQSHFNSEVLCLLKYTETVLTFIGHLKCWCFFFYPDISCVSGALGNTLPQGYVSLSVLLEESAMKVFLFLNIECQVTLAPPCVINITYHLDFRLLNLKVCNHLPTTFDRKQFKQLV